MEKNSFSVVTTFDLDNYKIIGKKMVSSFDFFWEKNIKLFAYYENMPLPFETFTERVNLLNFNQCVKDWYVFRERFKNLEKSKSELIIKLNPNIKNLHYKFKAIKFAHKIYAIKHALQNCESEYLIWIDSDVITLDYIYFDFLQKLVNKDCYRSYLGREHINFHSEASFIIFNIKNIFHDKFWMHMGHMYDEGNLFNEQEWHDCYIFDTVSAILEKEEMKNINICSFGLKASKDILNVFDNSILGEKMVHLKGNRKYNIV